MKKSTPTLIFMLLWTMSVAQVNVEVNLHVKHSIDTFDTFDRSTFITIHADQNENEWGGNNASSNLLNDFLNEYDVYMGRNTGGLTWNLNQVKEDVNRPGFADTTDLANRGRNARATYANRTHLHPYEKRNKLVVAGQLHPFWTGEGQRATGQGWKLASGTATGEYMGRYIKAFHGQNGQPMPAYIEVINEPAYESKGGFFDTSNDIQDIADFHNEVAAAIRLQLPDAKIGGYTTAFPNFELGNFDRWHKRWKLFMDVAGENMDFWSIHLYDFPSINNGKMRLRSGSNMEATFDMMEYYSQHLFGEVKPFVISEYGAQMHDYGKDQWTPYRDWLHIAASNKMLLSFMERPDMMASVINFIIVKAEWGYSNGVPYNHRLMRKANEPDAYTGVWVFADMVKFYQLWENVKGTRVDSRADDLDIQLDAYVDDTVAYVILNNLQFEKADINLHLGGIENLPVEEVVIKHLTLEGQTPVLLESTSSSLPASVELGAESTIIMEITFGASVAITETSDEVKYYATDYLKEIKAGQTIELAINDVNKGTYGEGILRLGVARAHGKSLQPEVRLNGSLLNVPADWRGDVQADRTSFFGVLEIQVPNEVLQMNNELTVTFPDEGGHISTATLQVFSFSSDIRQATVVSNEDIPLQKEALSIFPNPAKNFVQLQTSTDYIGGQYELLDGLGRSVLSGMVKDAQMTLDLESLPKGTYLIRVSQKERAVITSKLIVK